MPRAARLLPLLFAPALVIAVLERPAEAQDWCSPAAQKLCGMGSNNYPGTYTGTITMRADLRTSDYSRTAEYVIMLVDGQATCSGSVRHTQGSETLSGDSKVVIYLKGLSARHNMGEYQIGASCEGGLWNEEFVSVEGTTNDYGELEGQLSQPHPSTDPDNDVSGSQSISWRLTSSPRVIAHTGGPYSVQRGAQLQLDGSQSEGMRLTYEWILRPVSCPMDVNSTRFEDVRPQVTLLCSMTAHLTVSDGSQSHSSTTTITVTPREWQTPFEHVAQEGPLDRTQPTIRRTTAPGAPVEFEGAFVGGENVSASDPSADSRETLHPRRDKGSWAGRGYTVARVAEGPFAGIWYVDSYDIEVKRQTLINKFLLPGGPPLRAGSFYAKNMELNTDIVAYLEAIRAHEGMQSSTGVLGHSGLTKRALEADDPAPRVEVMMDGDRDALQKRVDELLQKTDVALCSASDDPLPRIWSGRVAFPFDDASGWEIVTIQVGGQDYYGGRTPCDSAL